MEKLNKLESEILESALKNIAHFKNVASKMNSKAKRTSFPFLHNGLICEIIRDNMTTKFVRIEYLKCTEDSIIIDEHLGLTDKPVLCKIELDGLNYMDKN